MDIKQLRSFVTAARLSSVSRAAELLGIGQPRVSRHIRQLETELGRLLFDRSKRPMAMTAFGGSFLGRAEIIVRGLDALEWDVVDSHEAGSLNIACTAFMLDYVLLKVLVPYVSSNPQVRVRIFASHEVDRRVLSGDADVGLVSVYQSRPEIRFQPLFEYDRVLVAPHGHPSLRQPVRSLEEISRWPLVVRVAGTPTRDLLISEFERLKIPYRIAIEVETFETVKRYVAAGLGVSVIPRGAVNPEDRSRLGVVRLGELLPISQAGLIQAEYRPYPVHVDVFVSLAVDILGRGKGGPDTDTYSLAPTQNH